MEDVVNKTRVVSAKICNFAKVIDDVLADEFKLIGNAFYAEGQLHWVVAKTERKMSYADIVAHVGKVERENASLREAFTEQGKRLERFETMNAVPEITEITEEEKKDLDIPEEEDLGENAETIVDEECPPELEEIKNAQGSEVEEGDNTMMVVDEAEGPITELGDIDGLVSKEDE